MRTRKRLLSILTALALTVTLLPTAALAEETGGEEAPAQKQVEEQEEEQQKEDPVQVLPAAAQEEEKGEEGGEEPVQQKTVQAPATLAEFKAAVEGAASGTTVKLTGDIEATEETIINLPAGVILDGKKDGDENYTLSGNIQIKVNAAGATIQNVNFKDIHNTVALSDTELTYYGFEQTEKDHGHGTPILAENLTGSLTITGCNFTNADWDSIRIVPLAGAVIDINHNTFAHTNETWQLRYVHIESAKNVAFKATVTLNKFLNCSTLNQTALECYFPADITACTLNRNYIDSPVCVCVMYGASTYGAGYVQPFVAEDLETEITYPLWATKKFQTYDNYYFFPTVTEAVNAGYSSITLQADTDENITIAEGKNATITLSGHNMTGSITNNGTLDLSAATGTSVISGDITNNGSLSITTGSNSRVTGQITNNGGSVYVGSGTTIAQEPEESWLKSNCYTYDKKEDGSYKVRMKTDDELAEEAQTKGYVAYETSVGAFTTLQALLDAQNTSSLATANFLTDVTEDVTAATAVKLMLLGHTFTGSIKAVSETDVYKAVTIFTKASTLSATPDATLTSLTAGALTVGNQSSNKTNVVLQGGTVSNSSKALIVKSYSKLTVTGGTYKGGYSGSTTTLFITGGTFSSDPKTYLADASYKATLSDGVYTVSKDDTIVASVGTTPYTSLQDAIDKVADKGTVKLLKDATENVTVSGKTVTLDLNGKKLTNAEAKDTVTVKTGATLTVTDTSSAKSGTVDNVTHATAALWNEGTVTLSGGTFDRTEENGISKAESGGNSWYTIVNHGAMTISGASVVVQTAGNNNAKGKFSSLVENGYSDYTSKDARSGYVEGTNAEAPSLTISKGTFQGGLNTVKNDDGATLTITGGTFQNFYQAVVQNHNETTISGGTFTAASDATTTYAVDNCGCGSKDSGKLTITGGTFTGATYGVYERGSQKSVITISDKATFEAVKAVIYGGVSYDKEGKKIVRYGDGTVTISGGSFTVTGQDGAVIDRHESSTATIKVTGGTFSAAPAAKYLAKDYGTEQSDGVWVIGKTQTAPAAPTMASRTTTSITLTAVKANDNEAAAQYSKDNGKTWQDSNVFSGLSSGTSYTFTVRYQAVTGFVSSPAVTASFSTEESYTGGGGGGGGAASTTTQTTTNTDGSKTTTTTNTATGAVTETTTNTTTASDGTKTETKVETTTAKDGSTTETKSETVTATDGSKTETKVETTTAKDGSTTETKSETVTATDGSKTETKTETKTATDGSKTETMTAKVEAADGSTKETTKETQTTAAGVTTSTETVTATTATGSTGTTVTTTDETGATVTKAEATVSTQAVTEAKEAGGAVTLPVSVAATKSGSETATAPTVAVSIPADAGSVKVEIPVENVTAGTVAILVHADGTEEIVKMSTVTGEGVALSVSGDVTVKIVDNSKEFNDISTGFWAEDNIAFVTSRELFQGTSSETFNATGPMTRQALMTVLSRLDGNATTSVADGMAWAKEKGISDGTNANGSISRQQLAVMLYRYAGEPETDGSYERFSDAGTVAGYASSAMQWAVANGIIGGTADGKLNPEGSASRAAVAAMVSRYVKAIG
jgi:hypothetical protein